MTLNISQILKIKIDRCVGFDFSESVMPNKDDVEKMINYVRRVANRDFIVTWRYEEIEIRRVK